MPECEPLRHGGAFKLCIRGCGFIGHSGVGFLPDERDVIVYLPPGYDKHPERTYPVLYLQDGQNLFDGRTSFVPGRTWQVREHADEAIEAGEVEPLVIVGIYNTGDRRLAEYTHERDWQMGGGEAEAYGLLMTEELMPWIAGQYRVRTEREHRRAWAGRRWAGWCRCIWGCGMRGISASWRCFRPASGGTTRAFLAI